MSKFDDTAHVHAAPAEGDDGSIEVTRANAIDACCDILETVVTDPDSDNVLESSAAAIAVFVLGPAAEPESVALAADPDLAATGALAIVVDEALWSFERFLAAPTSAADAVRRRDDPAFAASLAGVAQATAALRVQLAALKVQTGARLDPNFHTHDADGDDHAN